MPAVFVLQGGAVTRSKFPQPEIVAVHGYRITELERSLGFASTRMENPPRPKNAGARLAEEVSPPKWPGRF